MATPQSTPGHGTWRPARGRRVPLAITAAAALAATLLAAAPAQADGPGDAARPDDGSLLAFNHAWGMVGQETADAIEESDYLAEFANFRIGTGNGNDGETWTGRYLLGRETYVELFGPGDAPGAVVGDTGLAVSADLDGDLAHAADVLRDDGVAPLEDTQTTDLGDGVPIPWFDVLAVTQEYETLWAWGMEYRDEFLEDPRTEKEPAEFPGDVGRERYLDDDYLNHAMRDIAGLVIGAPSSDIDATVTLLRAGGFGIKDLRDGSTLADDGQTTIRLRPVPAAEAGLQRIRFTLNGPAGDEHTERIGDSTLTVGPGATATWTFTDRHGTTTTGRDAGTTGTTAR